MRLNRNNLIVWDGAFEEADIVVTAVPDSFATPQDTTAIVIDVLANDIATLGIDRSSLEIVLNSAGDKPAIVDAINNTIVFYPTKNFVGFETISYRFKDMLGNVSNEANVVIESTARTTAWRIYEPSFVCQLDADNENTGNGMYLKLEKYFSDTGITVSPLELADNVDTHPGYVAPGPDDRCPIGVAGEYIVRIINDFSRSILVTDSMGAYIASVQPNRTYLYTTDDVFQLQGVGFNLADEFGEGGTSVSVWIYNPTTYIQADPTTYEQQLLTGADYMPLSLPSGYDVVISLTQPGT